MKKDEAISAFAFDMGRKLDQFLLKHNDDLHGQNNELIGKILSWWREHGEDKEFAEYFGITKITSG
jgi:hypothetical protein